MARGDAQGPSLVDDIGRGCTRELESKSSCLMGLRTTAILLFLATNMVVDYVHAYSNLNRGYEAIQ